MGAQLVLPWAIELASVGMISSVCSMFKNLIHSNVVWAERIVELPAFLPDRFVLSTWLRYWRDVEKLVVPHSSPLHTSLMQLGTTLPVEVSWCFDARLAGQGVDVIGNGSSVRRIGHEGLVAIGYALPPTNFFEVRLDHRTSLDSERDNLNDFGIGVTTSSSDGLRAGVGDMNVADEVPNSWVVNFTRSGVVLSVDNETVLRSESITAQDLGEGRCVGILVEGSCFHVFVDRELRLTLNLPANMSINESIALLPIVDLYGPSIQISRTDLRRPPQFPRKVIC